MQRANAKSCKIKGIQCGPTRKVSKKPPALRGNSAQVGLLSRDTLAPKNQLDFRSVCHLPVGFVSMRMKEYPAGTRFAK
jgi:hypothetical protein